MRARPVLFFVAAVMAFVAIASIRSQPADPEARLPRRYRLADLIEQEQRSAATLRQEVATLRAEVQAERAAAVKRSGGSSTAKKRLDAIRASAGLTAVRGAGIKVTLDDSRLDTPPPDSNVNDLVIHSQDVQAVVNALWRAGAEGMAINGQRLVSTSAVLCVGNTLLLNGTVHSPPYVVTAIGASRDRFDADQLVRRLKASATAYGLKFSVERSTSLDVPPYRGSTALTYAQPVT